MYKINNYRLGYDLTLWEIRINGKVVKKIRGRRPAERYAHKCTGNLFNDRKEVVIVCCDNGEWVKIRQ